MNEGKGIKDDFRKVKKGMVKTFNTVQSGINKVVKKTEDTAKSVIHGRRDYTPYTREDLRKYGDGVIKSITIGRKPITKMYQTILNAVSTGKFNREMEKIGYDELFHLFMEVETNKGKIGIEKNIDITIFKTNKYKSDYDRVVVSNIPDNLTINEMLNNARQSMGDKKFFGYSARDNNCQDFLIALLKSSNLGSPEVYDFVKQTTKQLFNITSRKVSNTVTDTLGRSDVLIYGQGLHRNKQIRVHNKRIFNLKKIKNI